MKIIYNGPNMGQYGLSHRPIVAEGVIVKGSIYNYSEFAAKFNFSWPKDPTHSAVTFAKQTNNNHLREL